jgi:tRNA/tmRNA/rRNA uracil-C5-methylase (TrmA/RlmC/RlmD family)
MQLSAQEAAAVVSHVTASAADAGALRKMLTQQYKPGKAAAAADLPDVLVVDPPRKGLDAALMHMLTQQSDKNSSSSSSSSSRGGSSLASVKRLVYLSCGFDALRADADVLLAAGWRVASAQGFLFFPGTDTIETLAVFERE